MEDPKSLTSSIPERGTAIIFFKSKLCPACANVEPAIMRYASEHPEIKLVVAYIDSMLSRDYVAAIGVLNDFNALEIPTIIVYFDGKEVGGHVSTFGLGDQYEPLRKFVEDSLRGKSASMERSGLYIEVKSSSERAFNLRYIIPSLLGALGLGLIAVLSPRSLPMIVTYTLSSENRGFKFRAFIENR